MIRFWLITIGIAVGYIATIPPIARFFYLITRHKVQAGRMTGKEAIGCACFWPLAIVVVPIFAAMYPSAEKRRPDRLVRWVEHPTRSERRAARRQTAERKQRQLLDQARAEGLPVDIFEP